MIVIVCGGRDFADYPYVKGTLACVHAIYPITQIVQGGARGADALARRWATEVGIEVRTFEPDWTRYGKSAGPMRNRQMADEAGAELCIAFTGGAGTANMIDEAKRVKMRVLDLNEDQ